MQRYSADFNPSEFLSSNPRTFRQTTLPYLFMFIPDTTRTAPAIQWVKSKQSYSQGHSHRPLQHGVLSSETNSNRGLTSQYIDPALLQGQRRAHIESKMAFQTSCATTERQHASFFPLSQTVTASPRVPAQPLILPQGPTRKFKCLTCPRIFDRQARVEVCQNRHLGLKPYKCLGLWGRSGWFVASFLS